MDGVCHRYLSSLVCGQSWPNDRRRIRAAVQAALATRGFERIPASRLAVQPQALQVIAPVEVVASVVVVAELGGVVLLEAESRCAIAVLKTEAERVVGPLLDAPDAPP